MKLKRLLVTLLIFLFNFPIYAKNKDEVLKESEIKNEISSKKKQAKLPIKLQCNKDLICTIPENVIGLSCNNSGLEFLVNKKSKKFSVPYISEYSIFFSSYNSWFGTERIRFGPTVEIKKGELEDVYTGYLWTLDRKTLFLSKNWEYELESKNKKIPHRLREIKKTDLFISRAKDKKEYIMIFNKPLKLAKCEIIRPYLIIKPLIDKVKKAKKDNKI